MRLPDCARSVFALYLLILAAANAPAAAPTASAPASAPPSHQRTDPSAPTTPAFEPAAGLEHWRVDARLQSGIRAACIPATGAADPGVVGAIVTESGLHKGKCVNEEEVRVAYSPTGAVAQGLAESGKRLVGNVSHGRGAASDHGVVKFGAQDVRAGCVWYENFSENPVYRGLSNAVGAAHIAVIAPLKPGAEAPYYPKNGTTGQASEKLAALVASEEAQNIVGVSQDTKQLFLGGLLPDGNATHATAGRLMSLPYLVRNKLLQTGRQVDCLPMTESCTQGYLQTYLDMAQEYGSSRQYQTPLPYNPQKSWSCVSFFADALMKAQGYAYDEAALARLPVDRRQKVRALQDLATQLKVKPALMPKFLDAIGCSAPGKVSLARSPDRQSVDVTEQGLSDSVKHLGDWHLWN